MFLRKLWLYMMNIKIMFSDLASFILVSVYMILNQLLILRGSSLIINTDI